MMLAKILADMYVEPELLAELDEEQKQILFCKMREEQLRRYKAFEDESKSRTKSNGRRIRWRTGVDGEPWVWVMGDHQNDKSIDEILEEETQHTAIALAEQVNLPLDQNAILEAASRLEEEERILKDELRQEQIGDAKEHIDTNTPSTASTSAPSRPPPIPAKPTNLPPPPPMNEGDELNALMDTLRKARVEINHVNDVKDKEAEEKELKREREALGVRVRQEADRRIHEEKEKRTSEIYQSLKEARERANKEAEKEAEDERRYWDAIEKKAKEQEEQIRLIARKARELHRKESIEGPHTETPESPVKPPRNKSKSSHIINNNSPKDTRIPKETTQLKLLRPPKPKNREAIVQWFVREEQRKGTGLDPKTSLVASWFHGIISREDSETLLKDLSVGSYLVRVSERIWGYTLSFQSGSKVKHFLIECLPDGYQFLGSDQVFHKSLWDLVSYHQTVPVTPIGKEILITPIGQKTRPPDFEELFTSQESSYC